MNINTQQSRQRFTILPEDLQDAMFSIQTANIMDGIAQQYHLDDIKMEVVGKITGWVVLGFIHPEDAAQEIQAQLNLSMQVARDISGSLNAKIFSGLHDQLKATYAPVLPSSEGVIAPKIIQEIKPPSPSTPPPKIIAETFEAAPLIPKKQPQAESQKVIPQATTYINKAGQKPLPPSQPTNAGWSRQTQQDPAAKLGIVTPNIPKPPMAPATPMQTSRSPQTSSAPSTPPSPSPTFQNQKPRGVSEFDRLDNTKQRPASTSPTLASASSSAPPAPPSINASAPQPPTPPPVMLHQVSTSAQNTPGFQVTTAPKNQISATPPARSTPAKSVVLEFGGGSSSQIQPQPRPPMQPQPQPISRQQVMAPPPKPPTPPTPTKTTPAAAPTQPTTKVIVKDFLGPQP